VILPAHRVASSWHRALPIWAAIACGIALSVGAFFLARQQETLRAETEFIRRADIHYAALQSSLDRHLSSLHSVQRLMQLSSNVTQAEFQEWARRIVAAQPEIQVIEWSPRVRNEDRAAHEALGRQLTGGEYMIVQRDPAGRNLPSAERDEYFPVLYFEPTNGNEIARGFDVATGPAALELERARDSGQPTASGRIRLAQDIGDQFGLVVILPVYERGAPIDTTEQRRRAFAGCVRGIFRLGDLLTSAWRSVPVVGVDTLIVDASALHPSGRLILFHGSEDEKGNRAAVYENDFRSGRHYDSSLRVGLRTWNFLSRPTPEWWNTQFSWLPYFILVGGLAATLVVGAYVRASRQHRETIESTVHQRTAALRQEVAERQRAEQELKKIQSTLLQAQRIGRVGSWEVDLANRTLSWSEETFRIFGQDPKTFHPAKEAFMASVHPDDRERVEKAAQAALAGESDYDVEHRIIRPDGAECHVYELAEVIRDESGHPIRMVGTVHDITDRHYAEERLDMEHKLLRTVIDNLPDYIFFKDRDGRFVMNNHAHRRVLGVETSDESVGKTAADFLPPEVAMLYAADDDRILQTGEPIVNREEPLITWKGEKRYLLTTKIPLKDARGQVTGIVGVCRDITERKKAEDERYGMERKFQETQKLESLGVLAGGIAHDFNNLLTGILGNASLARMELPSGSPLHAYLEQIELSSQRAADLCRQMLAYSGKGRFIIQRIDLGALVNETLHLLQLSISKKAVLRLHLAENLPMIMADATQIRQIIMNLVMNASDAIGEKSGVITISTSAMNADRRYLAELIGAHDLTSGSYVVLEVSDNGCGMTNETKGKIFEPFFTTKFTGRGLGLAAVLGIVRGHKGALKVYTELGRGSTFKLLLPSAGVAPSEARPDPSAGPRWRGHGTVLVIDDEESVRLVAMRMLKALGFDVMTANDGEKGIHVYRANSERIAAVLLDLTMPHMDGEETFREIRRIRADACVILMSGFNEQDAAARFVGKGLAGFVQKPFSAEELSQRLAAFGQAATVS
jgi:PAS domain S-box-containing protein